MGKHKPIPSKVEAAAGEIIDAAYKVHNTLGPGLLESVYEACLTHELETRGLTVQRQVMLPVVYEGVTVEAGLRIDLLVNDAIVIELKSVEQMLPVFESQLLTYMKLSNKRLGFLINFNVPIIKRGIKRMVL